MAINRINININNLNDSQARAYNVITDTIRTRSDCKRRCFFLNGAAGAGKTYVLNAIAQYCKGENVNFISVAYTGIAACSLIEGSTIHSRFQLSWDEYPAEISNMSQETKNMLRKTSVILWDQAAACGKQNFERIDDFFRELTSTKLPFGGKVVVIAGDFYECLPILNGFKRNEIANECLKFSERLWPQLQKFTLDRGYRSNFDWMKKVGRGDFDPVRLPNCCLVPDMQTLIRSVFGDRLDARVAKRTILTLFNHEVDENNLSCISQLTNEEYEVFSSRDYFEKINTNKGSKWYDIDMLTENLPTHFPPPELNLTAGCPIILKKSYGGYSQGTRLIVQNVSNRKITAEVIFGDNAGDIVDIPKIPTKKTFRAGNVRFIRRQFPVDLCFSMTINKAQGVQFNKAGLYLSGSVFSHGQLYVALSRVQQRDTQLKIFIDEKLDHQNIRNIVATEVVNN